MTQRSREKRLTSFLDSWLSSSSVSDMTGAEELSSAPSSSSSSSSKRRAQVETDSDYKPKRYCNLVSVTFQYIKKYSDIIHLQWRRPVLTVKSTGSKLYWPAGSVSCSCLISFSWRIFSRAWGILGPLMLTSSFCHDWNEVDKLLRIVAHGSVLLSRRNLRHIHINKNRSFKINFTAEAQPNSQIKWFE